MVDRGRLPGHRRDVVFEGGVIDVLRRKRGFDFECFECAGLGGDGFLAGNRRLARSFPDDSIRAVDIIGSKRPGLIDRERQLNSRTVVGRISPNSREGHVPEPIENDLARVGFTQIVDAGADRCRRHLGDDVGAVALMVPLISSRTS